MGRRKIWLPQSVREALTVKSVKCQCGETETDTVYDNQGNIFVICKNVNCKRIRSKRGWME